MKTFKQIRESVQWQTSAMDIIFGTVGQHSNKYYHPMIPITNKIEKIFSIGNSTAFHFTNYEGAMRVMNNQNVRSKHLSATTSFNNKFYGVHHRGVVMQLTGEIVAPNSLDSMTIPDKSGKRWISLTQFAHESAKIEKLNEVFMNKLDKYFYPKFIEEVHQYIKNNDDAQKHIQDAFTDKRIPGYLRDEDGFEKLMRRLSETDTDHNSMMYTLLDLYRHTNKFQLFPKIVEKYIEHYFVISEKVISRFQDEIREIFINMGGVDDSYEEDYNEVVLSKYSLDKIFFLDFMKDNLRGNPARNAIARRQLISICNSDRIEYEHIESEHEWDEMHHDLARDQLIEVI